MYKSIDTLVDLSHAIKNPDFKSLILLPLIFKIQKMVKIVKLQIRGRQ